MNNQAEKSGFRHQELSRNPIESAKSTEEKVALLFTPAVRGEQLQEIILERYNRC
jgi:hypothetical protein